MDKSVRPFWAGFAPVSRLGWTALALVPMWAIAGAALIACAAFVAAMCAFIVVAYPLAHFMWGMQDPDNGTPE